MADNNIGKPLTMVEKVTEPDSNANIFINDNGKVHQAAVNDVLKNSDINTSLEKKETILGERVISKETETGWYKVAKFNGVKTWCIGNCNFKIYNSGGSDIFNLKLRCKPSPTLGYDVNEMYLKSLNGAFNNRVGVIVEQTITYLVVKHDLYYNTKITINNIISERQNISFELMTPELYSTDENPTLSLIPTGEISDIKNALIIQDISDTVTKSEFVSTLVLKKQGNHVFGYVRYKNIPPQTPLLDNLPKILTLRFYNVFNYATGCPVNASLWQSANQVLAYGEQSTSEYIGVIDYICV